MKNKRINIVIPMAGEGKKFLEAGYTFPKPVIDVNGRSMIQLVVENIRPKVEHRFIFICFREHVEKYSLREIFNAIGSPYDLVQLNNKTSGALCSVLNSVDYIDNDEELLIANGDQFIDGGINGFINYARKSKDEGVILTFESTHPRWSYARALKEGNVIETAEKKVISNHATSGIYYFKHGKVFVQSAMKMIDKHITHLGEFFVCPVYNEMILSKMTVVEYKIDKDKMHSLGTPEDLHLFISHNTKQ